ncbi:hypothetical protein HJC23_012636 [Cyclotella cryptica]|uniref:Mediator of RNA polymerase II transcription subunit 10 n=1 Tax=Cyclotella cryptica TaxID=29204 RepID=A0ABD3QPB4_9STRA|eukprot:CCRYP_004179-RA/>CCRYP_004179-RA protein AED:0.10 eAED:0.10 QI:70/1/1/1/1/1/2/167/226
MTTKVASNTSNTAAGEYLLERLRILLNRLQNAADILQKWPEATADSAKIHADTATELIASIRKIVLAVRTIERHVNGTGPTQSSSSESATATTTTPSSTLPKEALESFRKSLDDKCPIPLDLLDLLDVGHPFGTNPQVYARGLMKEAMRQLAGLERRKRALGMLADAIEAGMDRDGRLTTEEKKLREDGSEMGRAMDGEGGQKRKREGVEEEMDCFVKKERTETKS